METIQKADAGTLFGYVTLAVGSATGIVIALIQKNKTGSNSNELKRQVTKATDKIIELKSALENEREARNRLQEALKNEIKAKDTVEAKWESLKLSFRLLYHQYEQEFGHDPNQISLLKELKEMFNL